MWWRDVAYTVIDPKPGLFIDDTPRVARNYWVLTHLVRWLNGKLQPVGGWTKFISTQFTGIARALHAWVSTDGTKRVAIGTHSRLYVTTTALMQDITPVASSGVLGANPVSVTASSTTATITHTAHGLVAGRRVRLSNVQQVGGVNIAGDYTIATVPTVDTYTITLASAALATATGGGSEVLYQYFMAAGNQDGSATESPALWTLDNFGEDLLALMRDGQIHEWALADAESTATQEFVVNGTFDATFATGPWVSSSIWTHNNTTKVAELISGGSVGTADLSQAITLTAGVEYRLQFTIGGSFGGGDSLTPSYAGTNIGAAISSTGTYVRYFTPSTTGNLRFRYSGIPAVSLTLDDVSIRPPGKVKNGDFFDTFATGVWTSAGSDWVHNNTTKVAEITAGATGGDLSQPVTLEANHTYLLVFTATRTAGTFTPKYNSVAIGAAISASGTYAREFTPTASGNLVFSADTSFRGTLDGVQIVELASSARPIANSPARVTTFFVTPEHMIIALGATSIDGTFKPLLPRCCDQVDNTIWTPGQSNTAREFPLLTSGSKIVRGITGRLENLVWTDTALYSCRFVADASVVYAFDKIADGCGLVGPNAVGVLHGVVYWLSPTGVIFRYAGGAPEPVWCPIRKDFWDNITTDQKEKIACRVTTQFNEIQWHYPRTGNTECSHYIKLNPVEAAWDNSNATHARTAGAPGDVFGYPLAAGADGYLYQHESGSSADGSALNWYARTAFQDVDKGNKNMDIISFNTDFDDQAVNVSLTVLTRDYPNSAAVSNGPYTLTSATEKTDFDPRADGREAALHFEGNAVASFARLGRCRLEVQTAGDRL